ncbi:MAG TPA: hypothetical protein VKR42_05415, partial [Ktedonobacteraceae bacterium]|nr:hypothetical protein [Ktedonobacteraceae bacterium]
MKRCFTGGMGGTHPTCKTPLHYCQLLPRRERLYPRNIPADNQRLNRISAFISENGFDVGVVAGNVVFEQDTVAAEHL